jgi:hypothetical protein
MPGDETRQNHSDESESEEEEEEEAVPIIEIDPTKLTPLSPEVISKQVHIGCLKLLEFNLIFCRFLGHDKLGYVGRVARTSFLTRQQEQLDMSLTENLPS